MVLVTNDLSNLNDLITSDVYEPATLRDSLDVCAVRNNVMR